MLADMGVRTKITTVEKLGHGIPDAKVAPMVIDMAYVRLPAADPTAQTDENAPDPLASVDPKNVPPLDISIAQLFQGQDLVQLREFTQGMDAEMKGAQAPPP